MTKKPRVHKPPAKKPHKQRDEPYEPPGQPDAPPTNPAPLIDKPPFGGGDDDR